MLFIREMILEERHQVINQTIVIIFLNTLDHNHLISIFQIQALVVLIEV